MNKEKSLAVSNYQNTMLELKEIKENIVIFDNEEITTGLTIRYHKGTNIPNFFPKDYKSLAWESIFKTIDSKLDRYANQVRKVKINTGNLKIDLILSKKKKNYIRVILRLKKLKKLEAEKLGYSFPSIEERDVAYNDAQKEVLNGKSKILENNSEVRGLLQYLTSLNTNGLNNNEKEKFNFLLELVSQKKKSTTSSGKYKPLPARDTIPVSLSTVSSETQQIIMQLGILCYDTCKNKKEVLEVLSSIYNEKINKSQILGELQKLSNRKIQKTDKRTMKILYSKKRIDVPNKGKEETDRVCKLLNHEISTHLLTNINMSKTTHSSVGEDVTSFQEALCMLAEYLRKYTLGEILTHDLPPTEHHVTVAIRELFSMKESEEFIAIFFKLIGRNKNTKDNEEDAKDRAERVSRYGPADLPWSYGKDHSYTLGFRKLIAKIKDLHKNGIQLESWEHLVRLVYSTRTSLDGVTEGVTEEMIGLLTKDSKKEKIKSPILLGTILYDRLSATSTKKNDIMNSFFDTRLSQIQQKSIIIMEKLVRSDKLAV